MEAGLPVVAHSQPHDPLPRLDQVLHEAPEEHGVAEALVAVHADKWRFKMLHSLERR